MMLSLLRFGSVWGAVVLSISLPQPAVAQSGSSGAKSPPIRANSNAGKAPQQSQTVQAPDNATMLMLIRSALEALNQANATNNYTVLHALGNLDFQRNNSPQGLAGNFAAFRQNRISLLPALVVAPRLQQRTAFDGRRLRLVGAVPTQPLSITFDIQYERSDNSWKLSALSAGVTKAEAISQRP